MDIERLCQIYKTDVQIHNRPEVINDIITIEIHLIHYTIKPSISSTVAVFLEPAGLYIVL